MPEVFWKRQCSEDEEFITSELTKEFQKRRPQSAPLSNVSELIRKLKVGLKDNLWMWILVVDQQIFQAIEDTQKQKKTGGTESGMKKD